MLLIPEHTWEMRGRAFSAADAEKQNRGIFATQPIPAGTVVGDYLGLLIPNEQEATYETGPDFYVMYYDDRVAIWPDRSRAGVHIVNHSCEPNCAIATYRGHSLYYAIRKIHADEELTVSYLLAPIDDDCAPCRHACRCRARTCTGSMHLPIDRYVAWSRLDRRDSVRTRPVPVAPYEQLQPLDRYPARIGDRRFHGIFGATERPASVSDADRLPDVAAIRREIRRTGRRLAYPALGLTVLGTRDTTIFLEGS